MTRFIPVQIIGSGVVAYRSRNDSVLPLKDALIINTTLILVASLVNQAYMYIYITAIEPEWIDNVAEMRRQMLVDNGADSSTIDRRISALRTAFTPVRMFTRGIIIPGLWDFLFAGSVALFTRSKQRTERLWPRDGSRLCFRFTSEACTQYTGLWCSSKG